jgi:hypothetical protein
MAKLKLDSRNVLRNAKNVPAKGRFKKKCNRAARRASKDIESHYMSLAPEELDACDIDTSCIGDVEILYEIWW